MLESNTGMIESLKLENEEFKMQFSALQNLLAKKQAELTRLQQETSNVNISRVNSNDQTFEEVTEENLKLRAELQKIQTIQK